MKRRKSVNRLLARRKSWSNARCDGEKYHGLLGDRPGFKLPGSLKKPFPAGRGKNWT